MAVVNAKSVHVQNADAAVQTLSPAATSEGRAARAMGTIAKASSDSDASIYRIARVHSSWRIASIWLYNDAFAAAAGWNVGLYRTAADGGAAVSAACYFSGWAPTAASMVGSEFSFGAGARNHNKVGQQVWQDAGLSADPNLWYDIAIAAGTATAVAGNVSWNIEYIKS